MLPWRLFLPWMAARLIAALIVALLIFGGAMTEQEWLFLLAGLCVVALLLWELRRWRIGSSRPER